jgi:hypothetical protein
MVSAQLVQFDFSEWITANRSCNHNFRVWLLVAIGEASITNGFKLASLNAARFHAVSPCFGIPFSVCKNIMTGHPAKIAKCFASVLRCVCIIDTGKPVALSAAFRWPVPNEAS